MLAVSCCLFQETLVLNSSSAVGPHVEALHRTVATYLWTTQNSFQLSSRHANWNFSLPLFQGIVVCRMEIICQSYWSQKVFCVLFAASLGNGTRHILFRTSLVINFWIAVFTVFSKRLTEYRKVSAVWVSVVNQLIRGQYEQRDRRSPKHSWDFLCF
jgi:hypothetical protein